MNRPETTGIKDQYGRSFRTLRVSLLQHCNLGCVYCVAGEDEAREAKPDRDGDSLAVGDLLAIIRRLHGQLQLDNIRLTGGEPLLYPGLASLIAGIREAGISANRLTTNGFLLERQAAALRNAGLEALNVSLDAIDEGVFFRISRRRSAARVIGGIDAALQTGLEVKINAVIMKGMNDLQVLPLLDFAFSRKVRIRFLEVMAMGHLHHHAGQFLVTQEDILHTIGEHHRIEPLIRAPSATARYWKTGQGQV